jgi:hypothetical protein
VAAECVLAAIGARGERTDPEYVRAFAGAMMIAEAMRNIEITRKALTKPE